MRLIIDTDAGVDDAQAIMMALSYPGVTVEAITTVTGNVHVSHVNQNVFTVLDLMHCDVPVYVGAEQPLVPGFWEPESRVHGHDGLGNTRSRTPSRRKVQAEPAAVALVRMANEAPGELTIVALGPLTNLALACRLDASFPQKIKQFTFMGGTINAIGNTRNISAEFNAFCDPEAVLIVLDAFRRTTMLSWETTVQHPMSWEQFESLINMGTEASRFLHAITASSLQFLKSFPQVRGFLLPDPLAMAVTLEPGLIQQSAEHYVSIELGGHLTRGQTVVDYFGTTRHNPNVQIVTGVDMDGVYALYQQMLA